MEKTGYDIFISYRRKGGKEYARTLKPELEKRGFRVFLDFDELKDGVFDKRIMDAISDAPIFLVILSEGALDRCVNEGDWVREEILYADKTGRHIVPVEVDKTFRDFPKDLPEEVKSVLGLHQFSQIDTETLLQESIDKMVRDRIRPYARHPHDVTVSKDEKEPRKAEIHIEVDADCNLLRFKKHEMLLSAHKDNVVHLLPGKHKLEFVSTEYPDIVVSNLLTVSSDKFTDYLEISLLDQINERRKAEELQRQEEQRKKEEEERRIAEEKRRMEEETARMKREKEERELAHEKKKDRKDKIGSFFENLGFCSLLVSIGLGIWLGMKFSSIWLGIEIAILFGWFWLFFCLGLTSYFRGLKDYHEYFAFSFLSIVIAGGIHSGLYFSSVWKGLGIGLALFIADFIYFMKEVDSEN